MEQAGKFPDGEGKAAAVVSNHLQPGEVSKVVQPIEVAKKVVVKLFEKGFNILRDILRRQVGGQEDELPELGEIQESKLGSHHVVHKYRTAIIYNIT